MTYCLAMSLDAGFVCVSDSRTNAGADNISTYSKMHQFERPGERVFILMASGNLATTQAVVARMRRDMEAGEGDGLHTVSHMADAAAYVGDISLAARRTADEDGPRQSAFQATFILAGQIAGEPHGVYLVYPQGNYIEAMADTPFLQVGELKYGKPILDRLARHELPLTLAARVALVSMEASMRSNMSVGPPIELVIYPRDALEIDRYVKYDRDHPYWRTLTRVWNEQLQVALERLPKFDWE